MDAVIKVGGSLAETPKALKALCTELSRVAREHSVVVVPGGGKFADAVRDFDKEFALSSALSHRLAILAMDQYGLVLSQVIPGACTCDDVEEAKRISETRKVPVFLPAKLMFKDDALEASWDVTSDSIAAYVAYKLQAPKVLFVTDVDGIFTGNPKKYPDVKLLSEISLTELQTFPERTSVDKFLAKFLSKNPLDCYVLNGNYPKRVKAVLSGQQTICTKIVTKLEK
jgi:aspartokinase-like uncharacterized kinase